MSLLSEMINDLNKAKSFNGDGILLHTEYSWARKHLPAILKAMGFGLFLSIILLALIKSFHPSNKIMIKEHLVHQATNTNPLAISLKAQVKEKIHYISSLTNIKTLSFKTKPQTKAKTLSTKAINPAHKTAIKKRIYPLEQKEWLHYTYNEALLAIEKEDFLLATSKLKKILALKPTHIDARKTLAMVYLHLGQAKQSEQVVDRGLAINAKATSLINLKAQFLNGRGLLKEAISLMEKEQPEFNINPDFYATLAALYEGQGFSDKAGAIYKALLNVNPDNGQYWLGYAISLEESRNINQAMNAYQNALVCSDSSGEVRIYATNRLNILRGAG